MPAVEPDPHQREAGGVGAAGATGARDVRETASTAVASNTSSERTAAAATNDLRTRRIDTDRDTFPCLYTRASPIAGSPRRRIDRPDRNVPAPKSAQNRLDRFPGEVFSTH